MTETTARLRVAVPSTIDDCYLRHLPSAVEVVRYQVDGSERFAVDMLVPPSFGKQAAEVLPRIQARYIQTISAGVETIQPFVPEGVTLCNAQGVHNSSTAEWAVTAALAVLKWLPLYNSLQQAGHWGTRAETDPYWEQTYGAPQDSPSPVMLEELAGKTVLIVGYGAIGQAIEARLLPFEPAKIVRVARTARSGVAAAEQLSALLPEADIVIVITPLTPETHHLFDRPRLALMKQGAILVNAARGAVINTDALVEALMARRLRAALDVTDPEPLPAGHPLWTAPGLLLTPHIAGSVPAFYERVYRFVGTQLQRLLDGQEPLNIIRGHY